jgi:hypothetical protein
VDSDLLVALAGGAIGAVLAGIGFLAIRLSAVPSDVARHDRRVKALDEDLERWVADDHRKLRQELEGIINDHAARNVLYSGFLLRALAEAKTAALQRYRDRRAETERAFNDLVAEESWAHGLWRTITPRRKPRLRSPERVEPVIDDWRSDVRRYGMGPVSVYDATTWTTDDLLRDVRERPLVPADAEGDRPAHEPTIE